MRIIKPIVILLFSLLITPAVVGTYYWASLLRQFLGESYYGPLIVLSTSILCFYALLLVTYQLYMKAVGFETGEIPPNSPNEKRWMIYVSFWLLFFYPWVIPRLIPVPLTRLLFRAFGAKIAENSYFGGVIYDPHLVTIGTHVLGGAGSLIVPHVTEGDRLAHYPVRIGNNVTLGAGSIILAGVVIEDDAMIGALSVIPKNTHIGPGEVWAGNPARLIKTKPLSERTPPSIPAPREAQGASPS